MMGAKITLKNRKRLEDLCDLVTDGTHDSPKLLRGGVPFIKGKHISGGFLDFDNCDYISLEDHQKAIKRSKPEYGDILYSNIGSIGDAVFVNTNREFSIKNVALFKPNHDIILPEYLFYTVINPNFNAELFAKRSGVAQPFFSLELLRNHEVEYFDELIIQEKIVSILSAYDDLIENNLRRIKILEEMAQNLYREWFVNFRFPGHENARFVDSPLGEIPEGWEAVKVGVLLQSVNRVTKIPKGKYLSKGPYPIIDQGKDFVGGYTQEEEAIITVDLPIIVFGDHTRVLKFIDFPFARGADGTQLLKSNNDTMPMSLFYYALLAIDLSNYAYARHFKFLKEEMVIMPDKNTADRFNGFVEPVIALKYHLLIQINTTLRKGRDLLLPKLISGEVDVSDLEINLPEEDLA